MNTYCVRESDGLRGLPEGFLGLPVELYRGDPLWIPEATDEVARSFSSANPWFDRGMARCFCVPGKARVAVFVTPGQQVDGADAAYFGFWESTGDTEADRRLFARATEWARRQGAQAIYGPINFTTYANYRLRLGRNDCEAPFPGEPYNPPEYPRILERNGFRLRHRYLTFSTPRAEIDPLVRIGSAGIARLEADGYRFERLYPQRWLSELPELHALANAAFKLNFGYSPLSYAEFREMCGERLVRLACLRSSTIARTPDGRPVGFCLVYPHYGSLVAQGAGASRRSVSELQYSRDLAALRVRGLRVAIAKTAGVHPEHRLQGLYYAMAARAILWGDDVYDFWHAAIIRADNPSRKFASHLSSSAVREYGLYGRTLN